MSPETRKLFEDYVRWFNFQRGCSMPLDQRVKFQDRALLNLTRLVCALYDELDENRPQIHLPSGLRLHEPLRADE